jgi:hypothetical protein
VVVPEEAGQPALDEWPARLAGDDAVVVPEEADEEETAIRLLTQYMAEATVLRTLRFVRDVTATYRTAVEQHNNSIMGEYAGSQEAGELIIGTSETMLGEAMERNGNENSEISIAAQAAMAAIPNEELRLQALLELDGVASRTITSSIAEIEQSRLTFPAIVRLYEWLNPAIVVHLAISQAYSNNGFDGADEENDPLRTAEGMLTWAIRRAMANAPAPEMEGLVEQLNEEHRRLWGALPLLIAAREAQERAEMEAAGEE